MAVPGPNKSAVTPLVSQFGRSPKGPERVSIAIVERRGELDRLQTFVADNSALTKLVRQLPEEISHEVMVPFGSAAFFQGRFIRTNEFLVFLGEGYYAVRTSKQTVEILKRREKYLEPQVGALKASLLDLETEAKFFNSTAADAEEGIVEIREEYSEEPQDPQDDILEIREEYAEELQNVSESGVPGSKSIPTSKLPDEEDEHDRIMAMLDGLEKEELEAGSDQDSESGLEAESVSSNNEDEDSEASFNNEDEDSEASVNDEDEDSEPSVDAGKSKASENLKPIEALQKSRGQEVLKSTAKSIGSGSYQHLPDHPSSSSNIIASETGRTGVSDRKDSFNVITSQTGRTELSDRKAFTGSVIEHSLGLPSKQSSKSSCADQIILR